MQGLDGNFEPTVGPKTRHGAHKVPKKIFKNYPIVTLTRSSWDLWFGIFGLGSLVWGFGFGILGLGFVVLDF